MAELTTPTPVSSCCSAEQQASCCEPEDKDGCCGTATAGSACGCQPGATAGDIRETVRERYAAAALAVAAQPAGSACGCGTASAAGVFGAVLYDASEAGEAPVGASLGCGVPTAVADLHEGETVLDLGSGAGADVLISARRVGATGKVIGVDMTDEMLALARANAAAAGVANVEFVRATSRTSRCPPRRSTSSSRTASSTSRPTSARCSPRSPGCCVPPAASRSWT